MKRMILFVTMVVVFFTGAAYARTYKIGSYHWIGFSANDVANVKGFWKNQGLDVALVNFTSEADANNALVNKRVDISFLMLGTWVGFYMEGSPITIIAEVDWSHGGDKVIIKKTADISSLKGQNFGIYVEDPAVLFFLNQYLTKNGMKLSDIKIIGGLEAKDLADSFIFGRLKGVVLYNPHALHAEKEGDGKVVATTSSYPGCMPEGAAMRTDALKEFPKDDLVKIFKGWIEAVKWIQNKENWEEYKKILNSKTFEGEPPYSDKDLADMYEGVRIHDEKMLLERNKDGGGLSVWLNEAKVMLKENNLLKKDFKPEEIFDNSAIKEALQ